MTQDKRDLKTLQDDTDTIAEILYSEMDKKFAEQQIPMAAVVYFAAKLMAHASVDWLERCIRTDERHDEMAMRIFSRQYIIELKRLLNQAYGKIRNDPPPTQPKG